MLSIIPSIPLNIYIMAKELVEKYIYVRIKIVHICDIFQVKSCKISFILI